MNRTLSTPSLLIDEMAPSFRAAILQMPAKLCSLPPLNAIASRVLALSSEPDIEIKALARVLQGDPAFAAEVLFLANSPLFGLTSKMQALPHAISVLGLNRIKALAMTVAMRAFVGSGDTLIRPCWRHSTACAVVAEKISSIFGVAPDEAYSVALMHDIGRLGLLKAYPKQVGPVLVAEHRDMLDVLCAECSAIEVDHQQAGAWLVKNWALAQPFVEACEHHHNPLQESDPAFLQVVKLACQIADAVGYSAVTCHSIGTYQNLLSALPSSIRSFRFPTEEDLRTHIEERLGSFELERQTS